MSDQFNEQISEFIDDEMAGDECDFFVRRLQRDDEARDRYLRYQLIGTMMRGEHASLGADIARRVNSAINEEAQPERQSVRGGRLAAGFGIAASLALVALAGYLLLGSGDTIAPETADTAAPGTGMPVLATGIETAQLANAPTPVTGIQYLFHHTNYTSGLNRTIMHSSVVAGSGEDVSIEVEKR